MRSAWWWILACAASPATPKKPPKKTPKKTPPPTTPSAASVCFIHVGKSGGGSINAALNDLQRSGAVGDVTQVHSTHDDSYEHWDTLPAPRRHCNVGGPAVGGDCGATRPARYGFAARDAARCGPPSARCGLCGASATRVLWIRDPVSRFASCWTNRWTHDTGPFNASDPRHDDLDGLLRAFAPADARRARAFFAFVAHTTVDLSWYLRSGRSAPRAAPVRGDCAPAAAALDLAFVGRVEHIGNDWAAFQRNTLGVAPDARVAVPRVHHKPYEKRRLSRRAVDVVRAMYASDYECVSGLAALGLVPRAYNATVHASSGVYEY